MWHNVEFILCPEQAKYTTGTVPATLTLTGSAAFHNPYGFLPAESYGMLPFTVEFFCKPKLKFTFNLFLVSYYREFVY
jgi:hypothetical protein